MVQEGLCRRQVCGLLNTLTDPDTLTPRLTPDLAGTYGIGLQVSDGESDDFDEVLIFVEEADEVDEPPEDRFSDDDSSIFEESIEWMAAQGITRGCSPPTQDLFCPDDFVTRGQMAAFLHRALADHLTSESAARG